MTERFVIAIITLSCVLEMLLLLWNEQFSEFWTVALGAAYLYFDRILEKDNKEKENEDKNNE